MMKQGKTYLTCVVFIVLFALIGCNGQKEVTITKDYVINPHWDKTANSFQVVRMKLKSSTDSINPKNASSSELLEKLEKDTNFSYMANVKYNGEEYSERKVYFEKENGFLWLADVHDSNSGKKILGELQQKTWYLFRGLGKEKTLYYVYLDSTDNLHTFRVPASAWTNI
jgi:hypothetical protein